MDLDAHPFFEQVRRRRRAEGLTQSALAGEVGCTQSAVSMFESGRSDALSAETRKRIAERLGLEAPAARAAGAASGEGELLREVCKYCPVDDCPSNVPYAVRGALHFKPALVAAPADRPTYCAWCGEVLESACPNPACGAAVTAGAFCRICGTRYVPVTRAMRGPLDEYVARRREEIRDLDRLTAVERYGA